LLRRSAVETGERARSPALPSGPKTAWKWPLAGLLTRVSTGRDAFPEAPNLLPVAAHAGLPGPPRLQLRGSGGIAPRFPNTEGCQNCISEGKAVATHLSTGLPCSRRTIEPIAAFASALLHQCRPPSVASLATGWNVLFLAGHLSRCVPILFHETQRSIVLSFDMQGHTDSADNTVSIKYMHL
jgi:hypothetical protein